MTTSQTNSPIKQTNTRPGGVSQSFALGEKLGELPLAEFLAEAGRRVHAIGQPTGAT
jgi:hypothetical protein